MKNTVKNTVLFTLMLVLMATGLFPATTAESWNEIRFRHLNARDGLSQGTIHSILQDRKGFMWFSSMAGLNRYDGYRFTHFLHEPGNSNSINNNTVQSIYEDEKGFLWILTNVGLNKFAPESKTFRSFRHPSDAHGHLSVYKHACEDACGVLSFIKDNKWVKFDPRTETFRDCSLKIDTKKYVLDVLYKDRNGILWFGTRDNGLVKVDEKSGRTTTYRHTPDNPRTIPCNAVTAIYQDRSGMLWLGTWGKGLTLFDTEKETFTLYPSEPENPRGLSSYSINAICEDRSGSLWVGTGNGLNLFDRESQQFTRFYVSPNDSHSISNNIILSIYEDQSGVIWIGTGGSGVDTFKRNRTKFSNYQHIPGEPNSLSSNIVFSLCEDRTGTLWIGTWRTGLDRLDRKTGKFTHFSHDPSNPGSLKGNLVTQIFEDRSGGLWLGTSPGGLNKFNPQTETFINFKPTAGKTAQLSILGMYEDSHGLLWLGNRDGIRVFDPSKSAFTAYFQAPNKPGNYVFHLCGTKSGRLWLGTDAGGLLKFDTQSKAYTHYGFIPGNPGNISSNLVFVVFESRDGTLWIGTDNGLNKFHKETETFTYYTVEDGLPNNFIYGILEDNRGFLWLSTNNGISKFEPGKETFKNYGLEEGVQGCEFNGWAYYKSKSGEMFFGGTNGFNSFFPERIVDNQYLPRVVFTDFKIANRAVSIGRNSPLKKNISYSDTITLSYNDNIFSFEFVSLDYTNPGKNQFMYRVDGLNEDWIHLRHKHELDFIGMDPGDYTLRLKGSNNDGLWNEKETSIKISITPPFWQAVWFKILCVLFLGLLGYSWHRKGMANLEIKLKTEAQLEQIFSKYNISKREQDIFNLILKGKSNKNIEDELFISIKTVKNHVYNIYKKMGVQSRIELIHLVYESEKNRNKQ
ncbi:MAG: histidine kinase [bacterium]|nr:histidine kinase [bacterium]